MIADPLTAFEAEFSRVATRQGLQPELIWQSGRDVIRFWTRRSTVPFAPKIFISAGIHGDEPCGPEALLRLLEMHELAPSCEWVIAPVLNPAGLKRGTRENGQGIDLNRDFLRQESGEVSALMHWWQSQATPCDVHFSLHEDWEAEGLYLYEINTGKLPSMAGKVLEMLSLVVSLQVDGPVDGHDLNGPGLILHAPDPDEEFGWPEAIWLVRNFPVLSITLEAPGKVARGYRSAALLAALTVAVEEVEALSMDRMP